MVDDGVLFSYLASCVHGTFSGEPRQSDGGSASQQSCRETAHWESEGPPHRVPNAVIGGWNRVARLQTTSRLAERQPIGSNLVRKTGKLEVA